MFNPRERLTESLEGPFAKPRNKGRTNMKFMVTWNIPDGNWLPGMKTFSSMSREPIPAALAAWVTVQVSPARWHNRPGRRRWGV